MITQKPILDLPYKKQQLPQKASPVIYSPQIRKKKAIVRRKKTKKGGIGSMATTSSSSKPEGAEAEEEEEPTLESDVSPTL